MILIVGGQAQGKLTYALNAFAQPREQVADGAADPFECCMERPILNHFSQLVARLMEVEEAPALWVEQWLDRWPQGIIVAQEIGVGVVPIDPFQRRWREETGRICCTLAAQAKRVDRVCCGIATTIKGEISC